MKKQMCKEKYSVTILHVIMEFTKKLKQNNYVCNSKYIYTLLLSLFVNKMESSTCSYGWACMSPNCSMRHDFRALDKCEDVLKPFQVRNHDWTFTNEEKTDVLSHTLKALSNFEEVALEFWDGRVHYAFTSLSLALEHARQSPQIRTTIIMASIRAFCSGLITSIMDELALVGAKSKSDDVCLDANTITLAKNNIQFATIIFVLRKYTHPTFSVTNTYNRFVIVCRYIVWLVSEYENWCKTIQKRDAQEINMGFPTPPPYALQDSPVTTTRKLLFPKVKNIVGECVYATQVSLICKDIATKHVSFDGDDQDTLVKYVKDAIKALNIESAIVHCKIRDMLGSSLKPAVVHHIMLCIQRDPNCMSYIFDKGMLLNALRDILHTIKTTPRSWRQVTSEDLVPPPPPRQITTGSLDVPRR